jgi:CRP-like cAMP-binding protein
LISIASAAYKASTSEGKALERQRSIRPSQTSVRNRFLRALSTSDWEILSPSLELVELKSRQVLHHAKTPMEHAFFVERGLVSVSARVAPEQWVEVWLIGSEGMSGLPILLGDSKFPAFRRVVQVGGSALRISAKDLLKARELSPSFDKLLLRYASVVLLQTSQSGACNAHHSLQQRLARWLLLAKFALNEDELPITHNMLSRLLAVRRPSVTTCLGMLEDEGSIRMDRGLIQVSDPGKLEATCCHCHHVIKQAYVRLIGKSEF